MKKTLIIVYLVGFCTFLAATWEAIGPEGGEVRSLVVSATNDDLLFGASYTYPCRIIKSTNGGDSWSEVGSYNGYSYYMTIDPSGILYSAYSYYVYRSTDDGATWVRSNSAGSYIYGLSLHPTDPTIIFGCGYRYISSGNYAMVFLKSTDSGMNWTYTEIVSGGYCFGYSLAVNPLDPDIIYVGGCTYSTTYNPAVYKSTDGGTSFTEVLSLTSGYYVYSLVVHSTSTNIVCAGTYTDGIHRSTDSGSSWTKIATNNYNYRMMTTAVDPNIFISGGRNSIYKSTDAGVTWTTYTSGLYGEYYRGLAVSQSNPAKIFAGNYAGFFKTTNGGTNWTSSVSGILFGEILDIAAAPTMPSTMYTEFEEVGVYKTTNNGSSWTLLATPSACGALCAFAVHNTDPDIVYGLEGTG